MPKKKKGGVVASDAAADDDYDPDALLQALAGLTQDEKLPSAPSHTVEDAAAPDDAGGDAGDESGKKLSKAAKLRAKKATAEADRERAIAEAKLNTRDYAAEETAAIAAKLKPRGLKVVEVPSDGNCLYRSLLRQWSPCAELSTYQDVRSIIAGEMDAHATLYSAFVELEGDEDYSGYVAAVRSSSRWGGHVELQAASNATGIPIAIVAASADDRVVAPLSPHDRSVALERKDVVTISFHERQFFAGEHYNSVERAL